MSANGRKTIKQNKRAAALRDNLKRRKEKVLKEKTHKEKTPKEDGDKKL